MGSSRSFSPGRCIVSSSCVSSNRCVSSNCGISRNGGSRGTSSIWRVSSLRGGLGAFLAVVFTAGGASAATTSETIASETAEPGSKDATVSPRAPTSPREPVEEAELIAQDTEVSYAPPPTERRGGFTVGIAYGISLTNYSGYPNEVAKLSNDFRQTTGVRLGSGGVLWVGGALRDWLTVGVGAVGASSFDGNPAGTSGGFILHIEAFPLWSLGGLYEDLGVSMDFGAVGATINDPEGETVADGGSMSHVNVGLFYEPFEFWQLSSGPSLWYTHQFSQTMTTNQVLFGWRLVFYGAQPSS